MIYSRLAVFALLLASIISCTVGKEVKQADEDLMNIIDSLVAETKETADTVDTLGKNDTGKTDIGTTDPDMTDAVNFDDTADIEVADADSSIFPDVSGTWAQKMIFEGTTKMPLVSYNVPAVCTMFFLLKHEQKDGAVTVKAKMCDIKIVNESGLMNLVIPQTFPDSLPLFERPSTMALNNDGSIDFYQPKIWEVRSVVLDDPENDALPTDGKDPRVQDWDNDGKPGLHLIITGTASGDVQLIQKVSTALTGKVISSDRMEGLVDWLEKQAVVYTENPLFSSGSPTTPGKDKSKSWWKSVRIDTDADCKFIMSNTEVLFPN